MQRNKTRKFFGLPSLFVLAISFLAIWTALFFPSQKNLTVTFCDVGQGDAAYVNFPNGKNALVDGGPDRKVLECLSKRMPFYKQKIDIIFLSHPDADHSAGLTYVLKRYEVGRIVMTGAPHDTPEYKSLLGLIKEKNIPVTSGLKGSSFDFSYGDDIKVLYPFSVENQKNLNNLSEVLLLESPKGKVLFMGDLEKEGQDSLLTLEPNLKAEIIKVPHHGSKGALEEDFYKKINPKFAVISVGKDNRYGHPHKEVTDYLREARIKIMMTSRLGDITFKEDRKSGFLSL